MKNSLGQEEISNNPEYGCDGCRTSSGRMGCFTHGHARWTIEPSVKPYPLAHEETITTDEIRDMQSIIYEKL